MMIEFSGIAKIPSISVHIDPASYKEALLMANTEGLTLLPQGKLHITLLHQSVEGLKQLDKEVKKFKKGKLDEDPVVYPNLGLPKIDTKGSCILLVEDKELNRKTVRIVLRGELQLAISTWVNNFCKLNALERDPEELQRIYHVSFANLTGNSADSVR